MGHEWYDVAGKVLKSTSGWNRNGNGSLGTSLVDWNFLVAC